MKVLLLGGTGAMGRPIANILSDRGVDVYVTTRSSRKDIANVHYIMGNGLQEDFLRNLLRNKYDAIIDFMIYSPGEFENRTGLLLENTSQYVFLSSARVFADSHGERITEKSPRLLDVSKDERYLKTDEYALAKAREEDVLFRSNYNNYIIVRPYVTYFDNRLQLGTYEKEYWLQRVLNNQTIIFNSSMAKKMTTLTNGYDVALRIADLIGNMEANGDTFNITTDENITWGEVLEIYVSVIERITDIRPQIKYIDTIDAYSEKYNYYQVHYDRMYDRMFDNTKIETITREHKKYIGIEKGLSDCIEHFVSEKIGFAGCDGIRQATMDRITNERTSLSLIPGKKNKLNYLRYRYITKL